MWIFHRTVYSIPPPPPPEEKKTLFSYHLASGFLSNSPPCIKVEIQALTAFYFRDNLFSAYSKPLFVPGLSHVKVIFIHMQIWVHSLVKRSSCRMKGRFALRLALKQRRNSEMVSEHSSGASPSVDFYNCSQCACIKNFRLITD